VRSLRNIGIDGYVRTDLAELLDPVWTKGDQAWPSGAGLHPLHPIIGGGVTPQKVHEHHPAVFHCEGPLQIVYLLYPHDGPPNSCMPYIGLCMLCIVHVRGVEVKRNTDTGSVLYILLGSISMMMIILLIYFQSGLSSEIHAKHWVA
jgi:hypothetical protein